MSKLKGRKLNLAELDPVNRKHFIKGQLDKPFKMRRMTFESVYIVDRWSKRERFE